MQLGCFTCGHFHFLFLCLLLLAITNCSGMFAFLLFNRRKLLLKTVKTFFWSDDCKSQFLQNLGERLWWALLGFYFPVPPYSVAWEKGARERTSHCCSFHFWELQCICWTSIVVALKLCQHWSFFLNWKMRKVELKLYLFWDILQHSPCHKGGFDLLLWWGF